MKTGRISRHYISLHFGYFIVPHPIILEPRCTSLQCTWYRNPISKFLLPENRDFFMQIEQKKSLRSIRQSPVNYHIMGVAFSALDPILVSPWDEVKE